MSRSSSVSPVPSNLQDVVRVGRDEFQSGHGHVLAGGSSDFPEARPLASGREGWWFLIESAGTGVSSQGTGRWNLPTVAIPGMRLIRTVQRVRTKIARLRLTGRGRGLTTGQFPVRADGCGPRATDGGERVTDSGDREGDGIRGLTPPARRKIARQASARRKNTSGAQAPSGFTLVEMLVVLTVLAVLAAVALQAIEPVADQARYEATQNSLTGLTEAMLGPDGLRQPDGTPLITGFIADIGRPPVLQGADAATQLHELWDPNSALATGFEFGTRTGPTGYADIALPCGWRGPYLRLGIGTTELRDGWGSPFVLTADGSSRLETAFWPAAGPYTTDLVADATAGMVTVSGTVTNNGAVPEPTTKVVLLYPDPTQSELKVMEDPDADMNVGTFTFNNVPIGLRAIVYWVDLDGDDQRDDPGERRVTKYVLVPRTGLSLNLNYIPP